MVCLFALVVVALVFSAIGATSFSLCLRRRISNKAKFNSSCLDRLKISEILKVFNLSFRDAWNLQKYIKQAKQHKENENIETLLDYYDSLVDLE